MAEREGLSRPFPGASPFAPLRAFSLRSKFNFCYPAKIVEPFTCFFQLLRKLMAEREGFEPSVHFCTYDFQSYPFGHSGTSPLKKPH